MIKHNLFIFYVLIHLASFPLNNVYADENSLEEESLILILNKYEQTMAAREYQQAQFYLARSLEARGIDEDGVRDIVLWLKENIDQKNKMAIEVVFQTLASIGIAAKVAIPYLKEVEIFDMNGFRIMAADTLKSIEIQEKCSLPNINNNAKIYFLGQESSDFGSPSPYYGQIGQEFRQVDIVVTDTSAPVFLILAAEDPAIWRVGTIAGTHIAGIFINGKETQVLTGIASDIPYRIFSSDQGGLLCPWISLKSNRISSRSFVSTITGQSSEPAMMLKSGEFYFAGPIINDISTVMYSEDLSLNNYADFIKTSFGLHLVKDLVDQGSLRKVTKAEIDEWKSQYVSIADQFDEVLNSAYVVTRDIEYPAELTFSDAQTFIVPPGVNPPVGDPGHSRVYILDQFIKSEFVNEDVVSKSSMLEDTFDSEKFLKKDEESSKKGDSLYTSNCSHCHMSSGMGLPGVFPPLAGSPYVLDNEYRLASIMLYGLMGKITVLGVEYNSVMAPHNYLSNEELSSIANYIRTTWGNDAPSISPDIFQKVRDKYGSRSMFNIEELENNQ